ncbi:hypothetical protein RvY_03837 [Ramazzottius varieornatus]|uniref:Sulfatase N-terminal domain-containing protein n=1 Tax=Ramazzottius varieornatus TaxID=947166 RepID=A0A1D1UV42_RAMVA|nr:hypothetical protein RvY_03837 [Ramazzottius varieornatus]
MDIHDIRGATQRPNIAFFLADDLTFTKGRSLREDGLRVLANDTNKFYLPDLLTLKAEQYIHDADPSVPFYLHFATPLPHTGYASIINNTILILASDNGGAPAELNFNPAVQAINHGQNWPLRAEKGSFFEGGVRVPAFVWSPLSKRRGRMTDQLFHAVDWLPTLWEAADGDPAELVNAGLDGVSQWKSIQGIVLMSGHLCYYISSSSRGVCLESLWYSASTTRTVSRKEMFLNVDPIFGEYAMIYQDPHGKLYKIIGGNAYNNTLGAIKWYFKILERNLVGSLFYGERLVQVCSREHK